MLIVIPVAVTVTRVKNIGVNLLPVIFVMLAYVITDSFSFFIVFNYKVTNAWLCNIYYIIEAFLVLLQFFIWNKGQSRSMYMLITGAFVLGWLIDNILFGHLNVFSPYFKVFYCFVLVILSTRQVNSIVFSDTRVILRNYQFLFSLAFILKFTYEIIYEYVFQLSAHSGLARAILSIQTFINAFVVLIYTLAVIVYPLKARVSFEGHPANSTKFA